MVQKTLPWWRTDPYLDSNPIPDTLEGLAGPEGLALVSAYADGRTTGGWGLEPSADHGRFIDNYRRGKFLSRRALHHFNTRDQAFAVVMASVSAICVDIDGKNGGLEYAKRLGALPHTLSEVSKSGDGYHLFYSVDDSWNQDYGFARIRDRIGIEQGVDIRGTGCVFHYPQQRWNDREITPAPEYLLDLLISAQQQRARRAAEIKSTVRSGDPLEVMMMKDQLMQDLAKPIPAGKRNNTLFAIGMQMAEAEVDNWQKAILDRANQIALPDAEAEKIVANIERQNGAR